MMGLLVFKEKLKQLYGKYNRYMIPAVKFLLGASSFFLISSNVGFMARLKNPLVPVVMGLVAAVVPCGVYSIFRRLLSDRPRFPGIPGGGADHCRIYAGGHDALLWLPSGRRLPPAF